MVNKINEVIKIAKNTYEKGDFNYHIIPVVKNALFLAEKLKADKEVIEVAAYLHDITRSMDRDELHNFEYENKHHITSAEKAVGILKKLKYDEEFIEKVRKCVLSHRGRTDIKPETKEEKIVACADSMSHFDSFLDLLPLFIKTSGGFELAIKRLDEKMDRDWNKIQIFKEARDKVEEKYKAIKLILKSMLEIIG